MAFIGSDRPCGGGLLAGGREGDRLGCVRYASRFSVLSGCGTIGAMGRRGTGLVVLLLALAVAAIIPNLTPKHIAGVASVTPPPPPPAFGDCVLETFSMDSQMTQTPKGLQPIYSHPSTGSCHGTVYGQVSMLITNPTLVVESLDGSGRDANYDRCPGNAPYEDLPAGSDAGTAHGHWNVQLLANTVLIGPTPRQAAAGQHWLACAIALSQNQANQARGFAEPISQWRHSRQIAEAVGQCMLITASNDSSTDCSITHAAEDFGYTTGPFTSDLTVTCRKLVEDLTGMADPTAGGRLNVEVLSYDLNGDQVITTKQRTQTDTNQVCMVNGGGRSFLKGTLLALGSQPVPFG